MLKELIKLSTHLDSKGCHKEADYLDSLIKRASRQDQIMEERNYLMDPRTNAENAWEGFDPRTNTIEISWTKYLEDDEMTQIEGTEEWVEEEVVTLKLPTVFDVCDLCRGTGSVVNPSMDAGGLTEEDFDRDPDFREEYFSGMHDITCPQCRGKRVIPVVNEAGMSKEQKVAYNEYIKEQQERAKDDYDDRRTYMAEMGWG
jgi:hypothetical protein